MNRRAFLSGAAALLATPLAACQPTLPSKPRELRVLMSTNEPLMTNFFGEVLKKEIGDTYVLRVAETPDAKGLMDTAQSYKADIFILILNNMLFPTNSPPEARIEKALNVVSILKDKYRRPIIALAGWPKDQGFSEKAKLAGATFFFELPVKAQEFREAINKCLKMPAED
jgi:hypothetical protein